MADDQPTSPGLPGDGPKNSDGASDGNADLERPEPARTGSDSDATQVSSGDDAEATRLAASADPDATQLAGSADPNATQVTRNADPDATKVVDPEATRPMSSADNQPTYALRPNAPDPDAVVPPPAWRGSAGVRAHQSDQDGTAMWTSARPPGRAWWLPIVLGIVGLLILVGVAFALVAAMKGTSAPAPLAPTTTDPVSVAATSTAPSTLASTPASVAPTSVGPVQSASVVVIPSTLTGLIFTDVEAELNSYGLKYQLVPQVDGTVPANTVVSTDPVAGSTVVVGSTVKIIYAVTPPTPSPSVSPSPSANP